LPGSKNIQQLDLNLLKIFESLYHEKNMTNTSKALCLSPSAVSHAIKRLRTSLNDPLFVRKGQLMLPTPACERMAPQLLDILFKLRQILQQCGEFDAKTTQQTFKVAIHDAVEPYVIPQLLNQLRQETPFAKLSSIWLDRKETTRQLTSGRIDVVIDVALSKRNPIQHCILSSDPYCVLINKNNSLINNLDSDSYLSGSHLSVSNRASGKVIEDIAFAQLGITRDIKIRCQTYQTATQILKDSDSLLTIPSMLGKQLCDADIVSIPLPIKLPDIKTHLYWHVNTDQDEASILLRNIIKKLFSF